MPHLENFEKKRKAGLANDSVIRFWLGYWGLWLWSALRILMFQKEERHEQEEFSDRSRIKLCDHPWQ